MSSARYEKSIAAYSVAGPKHFYRAIDNSKAQITNNVKIWKTLRSLNPPQMTELKRNTGLLSLYSVASGTLGQMRWQGSAWAGRAAGIEARAPQSLTLS